LLLDWLFCAVKLYISEYRWYIFIGQVAGHLQNDIFTLASKTARANVTLSIFSLSQNDQNSFAVSICFQKFLSSFLSYASHISSTLDFTFCIKSSISVFIVDGGFVSFLGSFGKSQLCWLSDKLGKVKLSKVKLSMSKHLKSFESLSNPLKSRKESQTSLLIFSASLFAHFTILSFID
jgi:hypothetical protein